MLKLIHFTFTGCQFRIKSKMRLLDSMMGWLAPPVCLCCGQEGSALCSICESSEVLPYGAKCWHCGRLSSDASACTAARAGGSPRYVWVSTDYEGAAKDLIRLYKYGQMRAAVIPIAEVMSRTFLDFNSDDDIAARNYLLVPIPTASSRMRRRSFDHASLLARQISSKLKTDSARVLSRLGQTKQVGAKRSERLKQLKGKMYVKNPGKVAGRNILLVDDVVTTGATINAASTALRAHGAKSVSALIFAKKL